MCLEAPVGEAAPFECEWPCIRAERQDPLRLLHLTV